MKKLVIASLALLSSLAFAASVTVEAQNQIGDKGGSNATMSKLEVAGALNKTFNLDVGVTQGVTANTHAISTREELGLVGKMPLGPVGFYTRVATGVKYNNTTHFGYYLVEPGVTYTTGPVTAKVAYRFRDAFQESNLDATRTTRYGVSYAVTNKDAIGFRFDRQVGDSNNHTYSLNYTHSF